jgi:DNA repair exonuclease SbcCD ATPase subunit
MPNRYMCDVLDDMRKMYKTRNFSGFLGSVEQLQVMAYRMEAALGDKKSIEGYDEEAARLGRDLKAKKKMLVECNREISNLETEKKELEATLKNYRHEIAKETKGGTAIPCCNKNTELS